MFSTFHLSSAFLPRLSCSGTLPGVLQQCMWQATLTHLFQLPCSVTHSPPVLMCFFIPIFHRLTGLLSFMLSDEMTTGSVTTSDADKRAYAVRSHAWNLEQRRFKEAFPDVSDIFHSCLTDPVRQIVLGPLPSRVTHCFGVTMGRPCPNFVLLAISD